MTALTIQREDFSFLYLSDEAKRIFGVNTPEEMPRVTEIWGEISKADLDITRDTLRSLGSGEIYSVPEARKYIQKNGKELYFKLQFKWFDNPSGSDRLLICNLEDVTQLSTQERMTASLLNNSSAIILTEGRDHAILTCSDAWIDRMGYNREEIVGADLAGFLIPDHREHFNRSREKFLEGSYVEGNWAPTFITKTGEKFILNSM